MRLPVLSRWAEATHKFHNHHLGEHVLNGFHALALNETREGYAPVLWETPPNWGGHIEQVWFRGCHGDVGGQVLNFPQARPLANIPLRWILSRLEMCQVPLPGNWRSRFPVSSAAPSAGNWSNWGWLLLSRRRRIVGRDPSESFHQTVPAEMIANFGEAEPPQTPVPAV